MTLRDLAGALAALTPDPLPVFGRQVTPSTTPGLFAFIAGLASGQEALMPDHVVVGLHEGFFVTSSAIRLGPDDVHLRGRTLYLSAPALALLDRDEIAAVIARELAHFSGEDTSYTQLFLPVYAGFGRSLWAIRYGSAAGRGQWLLRPADDLGRHVMMTFDVAMNHWRRLRELAADRASAVPAGPDAAASALIRMGLITGVAEAVLQHAMEHPRAAPPDLVAAIVEQAKAPGMGNPLDQLTSTPPHPTDSHPANLQRIEALGLVVDDTLLARASRPVHEDAQTGALLRDWAGLCAAITTDTLAVAARRDEHFETALQSYAALPADTAKFIFQATRRSLLLTGFVGAGLLAGFAVLTYALLTFTTVQPSARPFLVMLDAGLQAGAALAGLVAALIHRGGRTPILTLQSDMLVCRGLDRPISWLEIADIRATPFGHIFITLQPGTALPGRIRGWRVRVHARRRCITLLELRPRGTTLQGFLELLEGYRLAAYARQALAKRHGAAP